MAGMPGTATTSEFMPGTKPVPIVMKHRYDNSFEWNNVYGHAVELIRRSLGALETDPDHSRAVHLDLGCGFGSIAEPLRDECGLAYIGIDGDEVGLASLKERGFETHRLRFSDAASILASIEEVLGARRVRSITLLDTLEHLYPSEDILQAIRELASRHDAVVVISVPNFTHFDIGVEVLLGTLRYRDAGILDRTHVRTFSNADLVEVLQENGLRVVDRQDVRRVHEYAFDDAVTQVLGTDTRLYRYLRSLRDQADPHGSTLQFVVACLSGPARRASVPRGGPGPFLSIITRTQGRRIETLREVFLCLAGQSDTDFEHLVVAHRVAVPDQISIEQAIAELPPWQQERTRLILVDEGSRGRPLNVGFGVATGDYAAILDDDDLVFGHWIEVFRRLALQHPGRMLRAGCVRQNVDIVSVGGQQGSAATGPYEQAYPPEWRELEQLYLNETPNLSVAFPMNTLRHLRFSVDESLDTTEDWDLISRVVNVTGIASSSEITSVYRWWEKGESSRTVHSEKEWTRNHEVILQKLNRTPTLLEAGAIDRVAALRFAPPEVRSDAAVEQFRALAHLLESKSWRMTAPLRLLNTLRGRPSMRLSDYIGADESTLRQAIQSVLQSRSWRAMDRVRKIYITYGR